MFKKKHKHKYRVTLVFKSGVKHTLLLDKCETRRAPTGQLVGFTWRHPKGDGQPELDFIHLESVDMVLVEEL